MIGLLLAVFSIRFLVNQVVLGVVLNPLALGLTGFGYDALMQTNPARYNTPAVLLKPVKIPVLGDIPIIGRPLFDANFIVYADLRADRRCRRRAVPHPLGTAHPRGR